MAMIRCGECKKPVSDKANACPACGNPIGGVSAVGGSGNVAFEKRIEQYKTSCLGFIVKDCF